MEGVEVSLATLFVLYLSRVFEHTRMNLLAILFQMSTQFRIFNST